MAKHINREQLITAYLDGALDDLSCSRVNGLNGGTVVYMFFDGDLLYDYGRHYVMAKKDKGYLLLNTNAYSQSTTRHRYEVAAAAQSRGLAILDFETDNQSYEPMLKDVLQIAENRLQGCLEYTLKVVHGENLKSQIRSIVQIVGGKPELLESMVDDDVKGYIKAVTGSSWVNYLARQKDHKYLRDLAIAVKTGELPKRSPIRMYTGDKEISPKPKRVGKGLKFLRRLKEVGLTVAAAEILAFDDGYAMELAIQNGD